MFLLFLNSHTCKRNTRTATTIGVNNAGEYGGEDLLTQLQMLRDQYGNIVKMDKIGPRRTVIFLFSPELCEKMYRVEGVWPMRIAMETLQHYRKNRKHIYNGQYGLATRSVGCFRRNVIIKRERELSLFFTRYITVPLDPVFLHNSEDVIMKISRKKILKILRSRNRITWKEDC